MAVKLFELLATLSLDADKFTAGVTAATASGQKLKSDLDETSKSASKMALDIAESIGKSIGTTIGGLISTIPQFLSATIEAAREMEAEMAQYTAAFGDNVTDADAAFARLSEYSGAYYTRLRSAGTDFYAQFMAGGMDATDAMNMMEGSMMLAADAAAFYDISLEEASRRLRSFLRGNVEAGESIGLFANDMSRTEKSMALFGKKWKELTEAQRELVLLSIAHDAYAASGATGQASREADNYANKLENIKAIWQEILATIGGPILEAVEPVLAEFEEFLKGNPGFLKDFSSALSSIADNVGDWVVDFMEWLINNSDAVLGFLTSVGQFFGFTPSTAKTDAAKVVSDYTGTTVSPDEVTGSYSDIPGLVLDMLRAADRFYDLDYSDDATDAEIDEAHKEFERLWNALWADMTTDQQQAMEAWMEGSGIRDEDSPWRLNQDGFFPEGTIESLPAFVEGLVTEMVSSINDLPNAIQAALSGVHVVLNDNIVGVVAAGMARNARDARYSGITRG